MSSKRIIEKLLDQIDLSLSLTFEHILKQLLGESTSTTANFFSFIEILFDYYLKITTDNSKKHLSDEFFKQIQQRQSSFLKLISFVIPYDNKHRLSSHLNLIIQNLLRKIDNYDLDYLHYQLEIISNLIKSKTSYDIPNDFYDLIIKKLLDSNIQSDQESWINSMKQILTILFLKEPTQISANDFTIKFLQSLSNQINWPLENSDYQTKLNDLSWRIIFIRMLATINALLTHRVQQYEHTNLTSIKKPTKEKTDLIINDDDIDNESESSSTISRQLFDDDHEEKRHNGEDSHSMQQQHSDLSHLEKELFQQNSIFYSVEKWIEIVRIKYQFYDLIVFRSSLLMKIIHYLMKILF